VGFVSSLTKVFDSSLIPLDPQRLLNISTVICDSHASPRSDPGDGTGRGYRDGKINSVTLKKASLPIKSHLPIGNFEISLELDRARLKTKDH